MNKEIKNMYSSYITNMNYEILSDSSNKTVTLTFGRNRNSGEIRYKGKSKILCIRDVIDILDLLHKDYHDLGVRINFVKSKFYSMLKTINPFKINDFLEFKRAYLCTISNGYYCTDTNEVFINDFVLNNFSYSQDGMKLLYILTLIHEVRHAWQRKYDKHKEKYIDIDSKGYLSQSCERDANKFAMRFMNKYKDEINEILRIDGDWYVNYKQVILK